MEPGERLEDLGERGPFLPFEVQPAQGLEGGEISGRGGGGRAELLDRRGRVREPLLVERRELEVNRRAGEPGRLVRLLGQDLDQRVDRVDLDRHFLGLLLQRWIRRAGLQRAGESGEDEVGLLDLAQGTRRLEPLVWHRQQGLERRQRLDVSRTRGERDETVLDAGTGQRGASETRAEDSERSRSAARSFPGRSPRPTRSGAAAGHRRNLQAARRSPPVCFKHQPHGFTG